MTLTPLAVPRGNRNARTQRRLLIRLSMALGMLMAADPTPAQDAGTDNPNAVNDVLGLRTSTGFVLNATPHAGIAGAGYRFQVPIDGVLHAVELAPHSVRAPTFAVEIQKPDGTYEFIDPGPPTTLRGTIINQPGSMVGGSLGANGLRATILLADQTRLLIEPVPGHVADGENDHIIYTSDAVVASGETCAVAHKLGETEEGSPPEPDPEGAGTVSGTGVTSVAEVAADADFEYFSNFGDAALVTADIENIINLTNMQYERDVQIRHVVTHIIVRTSEPNVYSRTCIDGTSQGSSCNTPSDCPGGTCPAEIDPDVLLNRFRDHWESSHSHIQRDVAQLFTGKNMTGSVIGVAFRGSDSTDTICGTQTSQNFGYSVVETNCSGCSTLAFRMDLTAHELGHNWSAGHCACSTGWTMNPGITSANRFHLTFSIPDIVAFRNTRTCLDDADELIRLFVTADATSLGETETVQLGAEADFLNSPNADVTPMVDWTIEPADSGSIGTLGVFTPNDISGARCVTVTGTFESGGVTRDAQVSFTLYDDDLPLAVASANPPFAAIDARQPSDPDGTNPTGWDAVSVTFNGGICGASPVDFAVGTVGGALPPPQVLSVSRLDPTTYAVQLDRAIEPGAWTVVTHLPTGANTRLGYLPGDVGGDGVSGPADILDLIDSLNNMGPPRQVWSLDVDRSGEPGPPDILAVIDLLNGAGGFSPWNGATLP